MAGTQAFSSAGTRIYISAGVPTTIDEAGFAALTYTEINEVVSIGALGPETSVIQHNPINTNATFKLQGTRQNGALSLSGARVPSDAGQGLLIAAEKSGTQHAVKLVLADDSIMYFQAIVTSYKTNIGNSGQITGFESAVEISGEIVEDVTP